MFSPLAWNGSKMSSGIVEIADPEPSNSFAVGSQKLLSDAMRLGRSVRLSKNSTSDSKMFFNRFAQTLSDIREGYQNAVAWAASDLDRSPLVDWVLDNFYSIQERIEEIELDLPKSFFSELPKVSEGRPRIQLLASELLMRVDCAIDADLIIGFAQFFQDSVALTIGECWAYSTSLKIGLLERLAEICRQLKENYVGYLDARSILVALNAGDPEALQSLQRIENRFQLLKLDEGLNANESLVGAQAMLDSCFIAIGTSREELRSAERHRLAATQVSIGNVITSLRYLSGLEWLQVFESINKVESILRKDSIYAMMDSSSQNRYRSRIELLAKGSKLTESQVAQKSVHLTENSSGKTIEQHVGYWLVDEGRVLLERSIGYIPTVVPRLIDLLKRHPYATYFTALSVLAICQVCALIVACEWLLIPRFVTVCLCIVGLIPISECAGTLVHWLLTHVLPVGLIPKMSFREGIPSDQPTFVVIPTLMSGENEVDELLSKLENHFLTNGGENIYFALLTDFTDADSEHLETDVAILKKATDGIKSLNDKYRSSRGSFYLFHRHRQWNPSQHKWMGWERKRGKILEFGALLLRGSRTSYSVQVGDLDRLLVFADVSKTPYIITLDSDTRMPRQTASRLIGSASHPLNRPILSKDGRTVVRGYTIFQPRVSIHLADQTRSRYFVAHTGRAGVDPYPTAASDVYQDLFGEGSFTGKGIYDLRVFDQLLHNQFPENRILSHDLVEGCFGRVALVSDIEVFDSYPSRYDSDAKRLHRWTRGDWQIASWLRNRVPTATGLSSNPVSVLSRWKIFDNLRRSLVAPTIFVFLLLGWLAGPDSAGLVTAVVLLFALIPVILQSLELLVSWSSNPSISVNIRSGFNDLIRVLELTAYQLAFLPHRAWQMFDAIVRTLGRLYVTHRNLLEWETAASVDRKIQNRKWSVAKQLSFATLLAVGLLLFLPSSTKWMILPIASLWLVSPWIGHTISLPRKASHALADHADQSLVMQFASGTWAYFESFVNSESNWLPPDNVQEFPSEKIAHRISPTNEGMFLVSCLCAQRLGFSTVGSTIALLKNNLDSWLSLPTQNGHHFNWYDTKTLRPLYPRYISTVDSGNLLASYLTTYHGLEELEHQPLVATCHVHAAIATLEWLSTTVSRIQTKKATSSLGPNVTSRLNSIGVFLKQSASKLNGYESLPVLETDLLTTLLDIAVELNVLNESLATYQQVDDLNHLGKSMEIARLRIVALQSEGVDCQKWIDALSRINVKKTPDLERILFEFKHAPCLQRLGGFVEIVDQLDANILLQIPEGDRLELLSISANALRMVGQIHDLRRRCITAANSMEFSSLYVVGRELFSIGFNVETGKLDKGFYDLLSSECRLASFLTIARGEVDAEHWFRLGRQSAGELAGGALLSWGGTMFEYLMPNLFLRSIESSLLDASAKSAVRTQIKYGEKKGTPWGISESAFSSVSSNSDYQYKSFGVPGLGLKRGLSKDHVVSPYSTMLAMLLEPNESVANLRRLMPTGLGTWGFYDAIDFTKSRLRSGEASRTVLNYMAHHQGMSLLAMTNVLAGNIVQKWFHSEPYVKANELLLEEKIPLRRASSTPNADEIASTGIVRLEPTMLTRKIRGFRSLTPKTHFLSNGRLNVMLTHAGGSNCSLGDQQVTRWRPDTTRDAWGSFIYIRDLKTEHTWSATYQPTCVEPDAYETSFSVDRAEYKRVQGKIESTLEVVVSPEHNAEVRQLRLTNNSSETVTLELTSYAEICLATRSADQSHPAFQKLFIETEFVHEDASILARRRPRERGQLNMYAIHTIAVPPEVAQSITFDSSRETFLGRGRDPSDPIALHQTCLAGSVGAVLDPVFSLRCHVAIEPGESITLGFTTAMAESRQEAIFLADFYHDLRGVQRALELAWAYAQSEATQQVVDPKQLHIFHQLGGYLAYGCVPGMVRKAPTANRQSQSNLWQFGISGDIPIIYLRIDNTDHLQHVAELLNAQKFLFGKGLAVDVIVVNDFPGTYFDAVADEVRSLLENHGSSPRHTFLIRGNQLSVEDRLLVEACSAILLDANLGGIERQLKAWESMVSEPVCYSKPIDGIKSLSNPEQNHAANVAPLGLDSNSNGYGCFTSDGYRIHNQPTNPTPLPWSNVLANESFGTVITNMGGGYTWFGNSRENKTTTWSNDPVTDPPSEIVYLRDCGTGRVWSPNCPVDDRQEIVVLHGHGYTTFRSAGDIESDLTIVVDGTLPVKLVLLKLTNRRGFQCAIDATYFAETVLGVHRDATANHQVSEFDSNAQCLVMRNGFSQDYCGQEVFLKSIGIHSLKWTTDRQGFYGRYGSWRAPMGIRMNKPHETGSGFDPCLAIGGSIELEPNETKTIAFVLGASVDTASRLDILQQCGSLEKIENRCEVTRQEWSNLLQSLSIETPDVDLDRMVNGWLLYQTIACRLFGRSAFYQSGGAYGFRDQLQDVMAVVYSKPELAKAQILRSARRQFMEGDVQHWWHPPGGKGTRTRFSDDFLFLPFVVCHYIKTTNDRSILEEIVPFLSSPNLIDTEHERYEHPSVSDESSSILDHCVRSIQHGMKYGSHGLPLMGCGDWNDGMSRVGIGGQGESVWVGWFQIVVFEQFASLLHDLSAMPETQAMLAETVDRLRTNLEKNAWDGDWYRRAFFDDGTAMGSMASDECKIDSLAQSWSVIANGASLRTEQAFQNAVSSLFDRHEKMVLLFTPPFDRSELDPGYIQGYLPGVRENGGQYTHGALWMVQAATILGQGDLAFDLFQSINPIKHTEDFKAVRKYKAEPYVVAADVYANTQHIGRGGWTWYTGSAAWMYRIAVEDMLGMKRRGKHVHFEPCVPVGWSRFTVKMWEGKSKWTFNIILETGSSPVVQCKPIELFDDGAAHSVQLTVRNSSKPDKSMPLDD
jgi:cyclic beta-1,2-glucan synthetase